MKLKSKISLIIGSIGFIIVLVGNIVNEYTQFINWHTLFIGFSLILIGILISCLKEKKKTFSEVMNYINTLKYVDRDESKVSIMLNYPELGEQVINDILNKFPSEVSSYEELSVGNKLNYKYYDGTILRLYNDGHVVLKTYLSEMEFDYSEYKQNVN